MSRLPSETLRTIVDNDVIEAWRLHVLLTAGCPLEVADELATNRDVDLHEAVLLLDGGCPVELVVKILT